ncbi:MAG TPA: diphosphomevalonate decarboxylase [Flavobacterium sp.]|jgi:diphosphomevalonate decarboxylase
MAENEFLPSQYSAKVEKGFSEYSAPSNIALVKYWGKKPNQIPANPSISFTLNHCKTITKLSYERKASDGDFSFDLLFEGQPKEDFKPKIGTFFDRVKKYVPFLSEYHFTIDTRNTFPHSSGIASSASGMAALAMNIMALERKLDPEMTEEHFYKKASFLARLGSGSACRSIKGNIVVWGKHDAIEGSSDLYGLEYRKDIHPIFLHFEDTILLVDQHEKQVSSSVGHKLMRNHPFANARFEQAKINMAKMDEVLQSGDLSEFMTIVESEALTLHAMMMTSQPYFLLMKPNTLEIINRIWEYRTATNIPVCFTLDAGANVHVLYPENVKEKALEFIKTELIDLCQNQQFICDDVGEGAFLHNNS